MNTYIVFDLETSNLNSAVAEIVELSALRIEGGAVTEELSALAKPTYPIDPDASAVNGITDDMVADAPVLADVLLAFREFIGNHTLVGYNIATFDLPILRRAFHDCLQTDITNTYIDVLTMAREQLAFLPDRKLTTVADYFGIPTEGAHRALKDCYLTLGCFEKLLKLSPCGCEPRAMKPQQNHRRTFSKETQALQTLQGFLMGVVADNVLMESEVLALKEWLDSNKNLSGQYPFDRVFTVIEKALADGILEQSELDEMLELFKKFTSPTDECGDAADAMELSGKTVCLTGEFEYCSRSRMEALLSGFGCSCKSAVSGKTDYVIVGSLGSPEWAHGTYGGKIKKALEYQEKGKNVQIIKEERLMEILQEKGVI